MVHCVWTVENCQRMFLYKLELNSVLHYLCDIYGSMHNSTRLDEGLSLDVVPRRRARC